MSRSNGRKRPVLITGGAGFIGTNLAHRVLSSGVSVIVLDNLSRPGVEQNMRWLAAEHGARVQLEVGDVRDVGTVTGAVRRADRVFHFAAQTAVTTSLEQPRLDFDVNTRGTLNVLEAMRGLELPPPLLFTSTNKVYGGLDDVTLTENGKRYEPADDALRKHGISESRNLDFHSPYGCSKGAADQYVIDYARSFGLKAVVFRMSCIYGPHQMGNEDQGWVAHFLRRAMAGQPLTIYGDGMQVRDVLYVDDLVDAMLRALERIDQLTGQAFNIGGGASRSVSLLEVLELARELLGELHVTFGAWRTGDQRYYVSDTRKFEAATGWSPRVAAREGIAALHAWLVDAFGSRQLRTRSPQPRTQAQGG